MNIEQAESAVSSWSTAPRTDLTAREILEEALYHLSANDNVVWIQEEELLPEMEATIGEDGKYHIKTGVCSIGALALGYQIDQSLAVPYMRFDEFYWAVADGADGTDWTCDCTNTSSAMLCQARKERAPDLMWAHYGVKVGPNFKFQYPEFVKAADFLADAVREATGSPLGLDNSGSVIAQWNDEVARTRGDVIHVFEVAIKKAIEAESAIA